MPEIPSPKTPRRMSRLTAMNALPAPMTKQSNARLGRLVTSLLAIFSITGPMAAP